MLELPQHVPWQVAALMLPLGAFGGVMVAALVCSARRDDEVDEADERGYQRGRHETLRKLGLNPLDFVDTEPSRPVDLDDEAR